IAPSITIGAVILLWRKAATKVIVSHDPSGTAPITLTPLGARPLSRTRFVLTAVSSIKTSRAGSRKPCSRIQRRRARATSSRCRSAFLRPQADAVRDGFFKGDVVTVEKTPERTAAGSNSPLAQLCKRLHQGQVWMLSNHSQNLGCELFEWRNASAARLRSGAVIVPPALHPLDRRCRAHLEAFGRLAPRRARSHGLDNAFPQVTRIGLRHRKPPPARRINARVSIIANRLGIPQIQIGRKLL